MQTAEFVEGVLDHRLGVGAIRHAARIRNGFTAGRTDLLDGLLRGSEVRRVIVAAYAATQIVDHDTRAFLRCEQCAFTADAACSAGDEDDLAVELSHVFSPVSSVLMRMPGGF